MTLLFRCRNFSCFWISSTDTLGKCDWAAFWEVAWGMSLEEISFPSHSWPYHYVKAILTCIVCSDNSCQNKNRRINDTLFPNVFSSSMQDSSLSPSEVKSVFQCHSSLTIKHWYNDQNYLTQHFQCSESASTVCYNFN